MQDSDDSNNRKSSTIHDLLQELAQVIQTFTNAEEREEDVPSTYWTAYKQVADEQDDKMLKRCNANMDMVLVVAALCSAVNATFIATMQPSPVDTTNALLSQLIQITLQSSSATQPVIASSSTINSTLTFWTRMLAYSSLLFSLLAALGAIMGKHWLNHYEMNRDVYGTREERCKQRHHKFQQLRRWKFENVLQFFTVLLCLSLGQFVMSLGVAVWAQDQVVSILSIGVAFFIMFFYGLCSCLSLMFPHCPFQTPTSSYIRSLTCRFQTPSRRRRDDDDDDDDDEGDDDVSTAFWILNVSTDLDVLRTASSFIMTTNHIPPLGRLWRTMLKRLEGCFGTSRIFKHDALVYGEVLLDVYLNHPSARSMLQENTHNWTGWKSWRDLCLPWALKRYDTLYHKILKFDHADPQHQRALEDIRNALRMVVATGIAGFIDPDNENLAQDDSSHFGFYLSDTDVESLTNCAECFFNAGDFVGARYALFLLSGVWKKSSLPIKSITPFLGEKPVPDDCLRAMVFRVARIIALRVACVLDYSHYTDSEPLCDDTFSQDILSAICPCPNRDDKDFSDVVHLLKSSALPPGSNLRFCTLHDIQLLTLLVLPIPNAGTTSYMPYYEALIRLTSLRQRDSDVIRHIALRKVYNLRQSLPESHSKLSSAPLALFREQSDQDFYCYVRLIFSLTKRSDWRLYLEEDIHEKCIGFVQNSIQELSNGLNKPCVFYLFGTVLHIFHPSYTTTIPSNERWNLVKTAWDVAGDSYDNQSHVSDFLHDDDGFEMLEILARETERCMSDASTQNLQVLHERLERIAEEVWERPGVPQTTRSAVRGLERTVHSRMNQSKVGGFVNHVGKTYF